MLQKQKDHQFVAMLIKAGLNNAVLPTLLKVVNNIDQHYYTRFRLNNAKHFPMGLLD